MQLIQNLLYYMNNNVRQTPPNLRSEAEALAKGMRKFLLKYQVPMIEFDRLVSELSKDIYFIDSTYSAMDKLTDQFSLLRREGAEIQGQNRQYSTGRISFFIQRLQISPTQEHWNRIEDIRSKGEN